MLRSALFLLTYVILTILWGSLGVLVGWMLPYRQRFAFIIGTWTAMVLWAFEHLCQVKVEVEGRNHIPATPCLVLARHESTWETLFLQQLFAPQATVIKKELLAIPFFGWAFSLLRPIAIDRKDGRGALKPSFARGRQGSRAEAGWCSFPKGRALRLRSSGALAGAARRLPSRRRFPCFLWPIPPATAGPPGSGASLRGPFAFASPRPLSRTGRAQVPLRHGWNAGWKEPSASFALKRRGWPRRARWSR